MSTYMKNLYPILCIATFIVTIVSAILSILAYIILDDATYLYYMVLWLSLAVITTYFYKSDLKQEKLQARRKRGRQNA